MHNLLENLGTNDETTRLRLIVCLDGAMGIELQCDQAGREERPSFSAHCVTI